MKELHIFSNGTEADFWNSRNCDRCSKSTSVDEWKPYNEVPCALQHKLFDSRMLSENKFLSDIEWQELGFKLVQEDDYIAARWVTDCTQINVQDENKQTKETGE